MSKSVSAFAAMAALSLLAACQPKAEAEKAGGTAPAAKVTAASDIEAGRYLIVLGGCNDCHTPGWATSGGATAEKDWLVGSPVGWRGPWGTTYPQNLRLIPGKMTEDEFVQMLKTRKDRPPMPWMNVARLHEADARAIYRYIKSLGPAGAPAPQGFGPGVEPDTPFIPMDPPAAPRKS